MSRIMLTLSPRLRAHSQGRALTDETVIEHEVGSLAHIVLD
jgi:hypothetical protein